MQQQREGEATGGRLRHVPALDGLRGLAVALVLLYHGGIAHFAGGHLGVTMFFTLSGFLITSLLLLERQRTGRISLRSFWARRARRLVPALLLCFPLVALVVKLSPQPAGHGLTGDAVAAALWVANWRFIFEHHTYADLFSMPSPFQHFWSLAVEEQYYLVFPVVAAVVLARRGRRGLALLVGQLIIVSAAVGVLLAHHAYTLSRAYYGTDSRIAEILVGALLALLLVRSTGPRELGPRARIAVDAGAVGGLAVLALLVTSLPYGDVRLFRGGLLLAAVATAVVVAAAVQPRSLVARALSFPPLVRLGVISYGVYLFHWPLFLAITARSTGTTGAALFGLRVAATLVLATASYLLVEAPVRRGRLRAVPALATWAGAAVAGVTAVALAAGVISLPHLTTPVGEPAAAAPAQSGTTAALPAVAGQRPKKHKTTVAARPAGSASATASAAATPSRAARHPHKTAVPTALFGGSQDYTNPPPVPTVPAGALRVLMVGDSVGSNLGNGLVSWASGRTDVAAYNLAIPACSISRGGDRRIGDIDFALKSWCPWWSDTSSPRYLAMKQFAPQVVIVEDGINALFDRRLDTWSDWEEPGNLQFDDWMVSEYQAFVDAFRNLGAKVIVANAPCGDWQQTFTMISDGPQRVQDLNSIDYPRIAGATAADFYSEVCPNGRYSDTVDGVPDARPDGFHFTPEASEALARDWLGPLALRVGTSSLGALGG